MLGKIKKRSGNLVDFDEKRIESALGKAFMATNTPHSEDLLRDLTHKILVNLEAIYDSIKIPSVEEVQDLVEKQLAEDGFFDVSKSYIIYRLERERLRDRHKKDLLRRLEKKELKVKKRNGNLVSFDIYEIEKELEPLVKDFGETIDTLSIIEDAKNNIFEGISTKEINQAILMAIKNRLDLDPAYSYMAARFLFNDLYKEVIDTSLASPTFKDTYKNNLEAKISLGVRLGRLDPRLLNFDFEKLKKVLDPSRDHLFSYLGAQVLYDRYFVKDHDQNILECPQYFWMRIAMGLALNEKDKDEKAIEFYNLISQLLYVPSSPTLFHSGTMHPQMSSCYLTTVEDDLHNIFKCIGDNAQLSKYSGGLGNDWTNIRGTGALIKSTNVTSQGVIPFLKIVDSTTAAINRSGKRRGATCIYLETWHYDIEEFLELRKNTGDDRRRTHDTNTANWIPDLFIERVLTDGEWTLFSSEEVPDLHHTYGREFKRRYEEYERRVEEGSIKLYKKIKAKDLWRKMITMLFETGHPWITFKDPCNVRSPQDHCGVVKCSNLCTEITLNTSKEETAVCNLGSINLLSHCVKGKMDWETLRESVSVAMRMLDNTIDLNFYPTPESENSNLKHRPVGLGIMGLQDCFYELNYQFESTEAVNFSDEVMEFISYHAISASAQLAFERGAYLSYRNSKWDRGLLPIDTIKLLEEERGRATGIEPITRLDWSVVRELVKKHGMRNSNCMAIAPTATIANIAGCLPSIEPIYKNLYVKSNFSGEFTIINKNLVEDLQALNLWSQEMLDKIKYYDGSIQNIFEIPADIRAKYKEVFEIDPYWLILHAAYRGKWIDQSQSLNIFTSSQSGPFIADIYLNAWRYGLKTTYYLRTLAASSVEKSTLDINKKYEGKELDASGSSKEPEVVLVAAKPKITVFEDGTCESCQ